MRRGHRRAHFLIWLILGPIALIGLIIGISSRQPFPPQTPPVVDQAPQSLPPSTEVKDK